MTRLPEDQQARDRAIRDHSGHLAVEAGAGTGKTKLLVDRIVYALREQSFEIGQLAAITFTRKAAGELRGRLRAALAGAIRESEGEQRRLLERARRELPRAQVSTIHSFCQRILRLHPLQAGLDPDFQVTAENRQDELFAWLWNRWIDEQAPDRDDDPLAAAIAFGAQAASLAELARQFAEQPDAGPPRVVEGPTDEEVWSRFADGAVRLAADARAALREGASDTLADGLSRFAARLRLIETLAPPARTRWLAVRLERPSGSARLRLAMPGIATNSGRKSAYRDPEELAELRERVLHWRCEEVPELVLGRLGEVAARAATAVAAFRDWAREQRVSAGKLSQNDLLEEARRLIVDPSTGAAARLRRDLRALMIDEYQDTDPIQAAIVRTLKGSDPAPCMFLVGDPKQSIYSFRRADVLTYLEQVNELDESGRLERIRVNFRSRSALIDILNAVAGEVFESFDEEAGQADWQPLAPAPKSDPGLPGPSMVIDAVGAAGETIGADELGRLEARSLAAELQRARREGYLWREMAVLFSGSGRLTILEEQLDVSGIPYRQEKSQDFFSRVEIAEMSHLATAIADPWDEVAVVALLRSRLFGLTDAALLRHSEAGGSFSAGAASTSGDDEVRQALDTIRGWHERSRRESPPALLEEALRDTRLLVLLPALRHGARAAANVRKLLDQAAEHWREGGLGIGDFARWLREQVRTGSVRETESPSAEEEDRVSLLTVHAAKGMQWRLVGLYDVHGGTRATKPVAVLDRGAGGAERRLEVRLTKTMRTPGFERAAGRSEKLALSERARLLYVALTRAKERVVVPVPAGKPARLASSSFLELLRRSATWRLWEERAAAGEHPSSPSVERAVAAEPDESVPPRATRPSDADRDEAIARKAAFLSARGELLVRADNAVVAAPSDLHDGSFEGSGGGSSRLAIGSAVHQALEWLVLGVAREPADAGRLAATAAGLGERAPEIKQIVGMLRHATSSETWREARAAPWVYPELPVSWHTTLADLPRRCRELLAERLAERGQAARSDATRVVVEGFADLVYGSPEHLTVVDFKTDAWSSDDDVRRLVRLYGAQVALYRAALRSMPRVEQVSAGLLLLGGVGPRYVEIELGA